MKYLVFFFLSIGLLFSCNNNEDEIFEMSYEVDVILEAGIDQFRAHFIDSYGIDTRINSFLAASGRTREDIGAILPKSAEIVNLQTDVSLDFLRLATIDVFEGSILDPDERINEREIFFRDNVPQDRAVFVDLLPSLPDVKEYLLEDDFNISLKVELRSPPPNTIEARLRLTFSAQ